MQKKTQKKNIDSLLYLLFSSEEVGGKKSFLETWRSTSLSQELPQQLRGEFIEKSGILLLIKNRTKTRFDLMPSPPCSSGLPLPTEVTE